MKQEQTQAVEAAKEPTREGFFAYFDQMTDENGQIITTADWLADTAMLIVHEAKRDAGRDHPDEKEEKENDKCAV